MSSATLPVVEGDAALAETGLAEWGASLPEGDEGLVDEAAGTAVHWVEGTGWVEQSG